MMKKAGLDPRYLGVLLARLESEVGRRGALPSFLSSHPSTEERGRLSGAAPADAEGEEEIDREEAAEAKQAPGTRKLNAIDPVQRQVVSLLEQRDYPELESVLGSLQLAFEADESASVSLEKAYHAFDKVPRGADAAFNEWAKKYPSSYAALTARGSYFYYQGLDARGTEYFRNTPAKNIRAMRSYLGWARLDLEHSLTLTTKPYLSRMTLMSIDRANGNRRGESAQYQEAVKLAPQSVELRVARIFGLEPRWGGSYREMERFLAESRSQLKDPAAVARLAARIPAYRGYERQQAGDYQQARKHYDESIALYAGAGALCERSYVLGQLQRHEEAFADIKLALSKARDNRYCLDLAASAAAVIKSPLEAIDVMNLVIESDPASVHALNQRGWRQQQLGKLDLAFQDYLASARLGDDWGQLMAGKMRWAGRGVGENRDEALEWLRKSADQGNADARTSLEQALQQIGKK
jgi:tetratricopeptide (TPR) repeat protein